MALVTGVCWRNERVGAIFKILANRPSAKLFSVMWRQWRIMSLLYLRTRRMVSSPTRSMRRAMHPPAQRECVLMSALVKPVDRPADHKTALMTALMLFPRICCHLLPFLKLEIGVFPMAPWRCRYATWRRMAATGHSWVWTVRPCPTNYLLTLFL